MNQNIPDISLGIDDLGLDFEIGASLLDRLDRQVKAADPPRQGSANLLGRNDQPDRIDDGTLGHGHAEELASLLLNDRAAAVAWLKRAVDLEQQVWP